MEDFLTKNDLKGLKGALNDEDLRTSLDKFIEKYVCCENCWEPKTSGRVSSEVTFQRSTCT